MSRPDLSLCMIVRDEESMLPGFLSAAEGLWDELIVADTGSTDRSREILSAAGASVHEIPWQEDFAAARNASLAPARGRWVLFLDADERVSPLLRDEIRALLADAGAGAATVVMRNALPDGNHREARLLRLFRNDPAIRFRHRIHEDVADGVGAFLAREGLTLRHLAGAVDHLGYVREVAADRGKKERDLRLLRAVVAADPDDFYCWFKLLELARFWDDRHLWQKTAALAAAQFDRSGARLLADEVWGGELAALIAQGLSAGPAAALAWLDDRAPHVRPSAPWHLRRGLLLEELGRADEAAAAFEASQAVGDVASSHMSAVRPRLGLCRLAAARRDVDAACAHALAAAGAGPRDPEALLAVATFLPLARDESALGDFAAAHVATHPDAARPLAEALLAAGRPAVASDVLASPAAADGVFALGLAVCAMTLGREIDLQVDLDQKSADDALRAWIRALWNSCRTDLLGAFADNCGPLLAPFPWLPDFLQGETDRLKNP